MTDAANARGEKRKMNIVSFLFALFDHKAEVKLNNCNKEDRIDMNFSACAMCIWKF